jgi:hypothetical protein
LPLPSGGGCKIGCHLWQNLCHLKGALTKGREAQHIVDQITDIKSSCTVCHYTWVHSTNTAQLLDSNRWHC